MFILFSHFSVCLKLFSKIGFANKTPIVTIDSPDSRQGWKPIGEGECFEEIGLHLMLKVSIDGRCPCWTNGHVAHPTANPLTPGLESPIFFQVPVSNILMELFSFEVEMSRSVGRMMAVGFGEFLLLDKNWGIYTPLCWRGSEIGRGMMRGTLG